MVSSVDPVTQATLAHLQATPGVQQDAAGARMFADLMKGAVGAEPGKATGAGSLLAPAEPQGGTTAEMLQQLGAMQDPSDPIKAQFVMMDVLGKRMEFLGRVHYTVALGSGFTGIFKQLFNRHD